MYVATLPRGFRQDLGDRLAQAGVVIGYGQFDAAQAALLEPQEKLSPTGLALTVGELHAQDLPLPLPVDPDR